MAKKKGAADESTEAKSKAKKPSAAKKPPAKKPVAKKPAKKKKDEDKVETAAEREDVIEAEILAETPASVEAEREEAIVTAEIEVEPEVEATPLTEEEQELSAVYGEELTAPASAHSE